jgi:cardiolipin synthase
VFVEEFLQEVRRERFAPAALARYARAVAGRVREAMVANPGAVRSVWSLALGFFAADFVGSAALLFRAERHLATTFFLWTSAAIAVSFAITTLAIDLLRDRHGYRLSAINVPTALTLLRVAMLPGILLCLVERHPGLAFGLYVAAILTDVADGWVARRFGQITDLGTVMDPIVDIVFNLVILAGLWIADLLPAWVLAVGGIRYAVLLFGGAYLYVFVGPVRIHPTWFGRMTGVLMTALVGLLLLLRVGGWRAGERLIPLTEIALGVLLAATVVHVIALGWYNLKVMTAEAAASGRVVGDVRWGRR